MRRSHRRRHRRRPAVPGWTSGIIGRLRAHPLRAFLLGGAGLLLAWLTLTKTLPFALAPVSPDWALALNSTNPTALIAKATKIHEQMLAWTEPAQEGPAAQLANTLEKLPPANAGNSSIDPGGERADMLRQIRTLAARALLSDPLSAAACQLLGATADDAESARGFMQASANRSRRQAGAHFWLLNDALHRRDYGEGLEYANLLLRTQPGLSAYVAPYILSAAETVEGFPLVVEALKGRPSWRGAFFDVVRTDRLQTEVPLKLMIALKASGAPPTPGELAPWLDALIRKNQADTAYNAWLQLLPEAQSTDVEWLANGNFEKAPSGLPFDWRIAPGLNAVAEMVPSGDEGLLHVMFGSGRVRFPAVSQVVVLGPGRYRLQGKLRGRIVAKRGLRWQLLCSSGSGPVLAETEMLMGETQQWRIFSLDIDVPGNRCTGQTVRLIHDSRSASEEFISGEVWFGNLRLDRLENGSYAH